MKKYSVILFFMISTAYALENSLIKTQILLGSLKHALSQLYHEVIKNFPQADFVKPFTLEIAEDEFDQIEPIEQVKNYFNGLLRALEGALSCTEKREDTAKILGIIKTVEKYSAPEYFQKENFYVRIKASIETSIKEIKTIIDFLNHDLEPFNASNKNYDTAVKAYFDSIKKYHDDFTRILIKDFKFKSVCLWKDKITYLEAQFNAFQKAVALSTLSQAEKNDISNQMSQIRHTLRVPPYTTGTSQEDIKDIQHKTTEKQAKNVDPTVLIKEKFGNLSDEEKKKVFEKYQQSWNTSLEEDVKNYFSKLDTFLKNRNNTQLFINGDRAQSIVDDFEEQVNDLFSSESSLSKQLSDFTRTMSELRKTYQLEPYADYLAEKKKKLDDAKKSSDVKPSKPPKPATVVNISHFEYIKSPDLGSELAQAERYLFDLTSIYDKLDSEFNNNKDIKVRSDIEKLIALLEDFKKKIMNSSNTLNTGQKYTLGNTVKSLESKVNKLQANLPKKSA